MDSHLIVRMVSTKVHAPSACASVLTLILFAHKTKYILLSSYPESLGQTFTISDYDFEVTSSNNSSKIKGESTPEAKKNKVGE